MSIYVKKIKYEKLKHINTEVLFELATARAGKFNIVRFDVEKSGEEPKNTQKTLSNLERILKSAKKRSAIQFFVTEDGVKESTTEAKYLFNVYPEAEESIPTDVSFIFVKL